MGPLALHHLNALELSAAELVSLAGELGCEHVGLFTNVPRSGVPVPPITAAEVPDIRSRIDSTGVTVVGVEFFRLTGEEELAAFRPAVEIGAQLGGRQLVAIIHDTEQTRATDGLAGLCDLAAEYGLDVMLEFTGVTPGCASLASAIGFLQRIDKPNAGLTIDSLHLIRTGGSAADVSAAPRELIRYAQICDGPDLSVSNDYGVEVFDRMVPGAGVFPLVDIFGAMPAGTPLDVEVPSASAQHRGVPAAERARRAVAGAREILDRLHPT